jgi:hypothetical protein
MGRVGVKVGKGTVGWVGVLIGCDVGKTVVFVGAMAAGLDVCVVLDPTQLVAKSKKAIKIILWVLVIPKNSCHTTIKRSLNLTFNWTISFRIIINIGC